MNFIGIFKKTFYDVDKPLDNKASDLLYHKFRDIILAFDSYEWSLCENDRKHKFNPYDYSFSLNLDF